MRLLAYPLLCFALSSAPFVEAATLLSKKGRVSVTRSGKRVRAGVGARLRPGDIVKTRRASFALIRLSKNSWVKLKEKSEVVISKGDVKTRLRKIFLRAGGAFAKVTRGTRFELETPTAVAAVRGTEFFTAYGRSSKKGRDLWLCVNEGTVEVTETETRSSVLVREGEGIIVQPDTEIAPPKAYEWTRGLNWNMDPESDDLEDHSSLDSAYENELLDQDYD